MTDELEKAVKGKRLSMQARKKWKENQVKKKNRKREGIEMKEKYKQIVLSFYCSFQEVESFCMISFLL